MGLLDDLDRRRERVARDNENSARLAQSYAVFRTTGVGTHQYEERVTFGLTFTEKPVVSYGNVCDLEELAALFTGEGGQLDSEDISLPLTSGFVVDWDQDERGFYTGCWVAVIVWFPPWAWIPEGGGDVPVEVEHHFTFAAIGMKDIPPDQGDAVT